MRVGHSSLRIAAVAALLFATTLTARAAGIDEADATFLQAASQANAAEIKVSQAAQTRAKDAQVRAFADRMVKDHSAIGHEIEDLAKRKNVDVKTEPDAAHMVKIGGLQKLEGSAFDHGYASLMVQDHAALVQSFGKAAGASDGDADVKRFAAHALPMLRDHATAALALPR